MSADTENTTTAPSSTVTAAHTQPLPPIDDASLPAAKTPAQRIDELERAVMKNQKMFAFGGVIQKQFIDPANFAVFYAGTDGPAQLRLPATNEALTKLHESAQVSPFGREKELVYDDTYRQARQLKNPDFALSQDLVANSLVVPYLSVNLDCTETHIVARANKLNSYSVGGFFKPHRDTPLGQGHIGTLTFCLPTEFTGGELLVRHDGKEVAFDWGRKSEGSGRDLVQWAFLYSDCEHEVLPVLSGTRITVAYDVWNYARLEPLSQLSVSINPLAEHLAGLLSDKTLFLPDGGRLAFGARHAYAMPAGGTGRENLEKLIASFKGQDRALAGALDKLGLKWSIRAVYDVDTDGMSEYREEEDRSKRSRTEDTQRAEKAALDTVICVETVGQRYDLITGDSFYQCEGSYVESVMFHYCMEEGGFSVDNDAIWVSQPGAYGHENHYISYGNEPESNSVYVGVAIFVDIPAGEDRESLCLQDG